MRKFLQFIQSIFFGTWLLERVTFQYAWFYRAASAATSLFGASEEAKAQKKAAKQQAQQA